MYRVKENLNNFLDHVNINDTIKYVEKIEVGVSRGSLLNMKTVSHRLQFEILKSNRTNRKWSNFIGLGYFMALLILNNAKAL